MCIRDRLSILPRAAISESNDTGRAEGAADEDVDTPEDVDDSNWDAEDELTPNEHGVLSTAVGASDDNPHCTSDMVI